MNIDGLAITNVSQYETHFFINTFYIAFELDGFRYELFAEQGIDGLVHPKFIKHSDENNTCNYCENRSSVCRGLSEYKKEFFHRLIEFPSIRLQWLYIKHA